MVQHERPERRTGHRFREGGGRYSVAFVAVNAKQAEDWNGASGRHFIEQRERHERMRGRLTRRLLAAAQTRDGANFSIWVRLRRYDHPRSTSHPQRARSRRRLVPGPGSRSTPARGCC